jgi:predicted metal-dependent enzyme (double-stranded beta helix superfamily)
MDAMIANLVEQLKIVAAEESDPAAVVERVKPLAEAMAKDTSWVRPEYYEADEEQGFGITILNDGPNHELLVEAICWLPGLGVAPHDHQTWGVVVGIDGTEVNVDWQRHDDGSKPGYADLSTRRETEVKNGDVCAFLPNDIHSVRNDADVPSLSLHMYGIAPSSLDRSEFDPITKVQRPCPQRKRKPAA